MDDRRDKILAMTEPQWREFVDDQFRAGKQQFEVHQSMLAENTALTKTVAESTAEIVAAFKATKTGVHFFSVIGRGLHQFAKWLVPIATLGGIIWALAHGQWPKWGE
jgi:hypothetical protein